MTRWICFNHRKSIIFDSSANAPRCPECKCDDIAVYSGTRPLTAVIERKEKGAELIIEGIKPLVQPEVKEFAPAVKKETKKEVESDGKKEDGRWF
ncbi:MAG: hypothetical protein UY48_C0013G0033 [Candidatus Gottesmanbacteria bacterium GW2011_GWB1_49_7]|uniref:Uncharacterized protein n=1 Tax=Candidatus Gottesmanbacteria bacterium GW2011_GWB1_49_7 TaxID=1618448 RepID=A0A0G1YA22_9BACT|nr:MAG: hypothetical protein UY48_C0013G0033 [Candidatus Gottesmanbacteria bacterium GW2011_GWB1_49_7]